MIAAVAAASLLGTAATASADARIDRGRYLVETVAACGNCHTSMGPEGQDRSRHLAGGQVIDMGNFRAVPANIAPDPATGIGAWSDAEIARAIREGVRPDGRHLMPPMGFAYYRNISEGNMPAIIAYLRTLPPME